MSCSDVQTIKAGDGSKTQFSFDFPYIFKSEIHVYFWNATTKEYDEKLTTDSTYPWRITDANPTIVEFTSTAPPAPATPVDPGESTVDNVKIRRITKVDDIRALFNPGSAIRSDDLNKNFEQLRYAIQESGCQGITDDVDQYLKDYYWDRYDNTLYDGDTWVSDDTKIATTAAMDARFLDETNETYTKAELAADSNVLPDDDVALPTTGALKDYVDHAVETDILVNDTGLSKSATGGQVTLGIAEGSVDLDRIKPADIIVSGEANPNNDTTIATTAKIDDMIDAAITGDIAVDSTGLTVTNDGDGTITLGIGSNSVDFDRIKNDDIITKTEQDSGSPAAADSNIFTASAAAKRFDTLVQTGTPSESNYEVGKTWLQNDDDQTLKIWNGSTWLDVASGGSFRTQDKVIYVDKTGGDDSKTGHRISGPKLTIKAAINDINADISTSIKTGGSGYTNGTYQDVPLTGGTTGSGLTADITVSGGAVTAVTDINASTLEEYQIGDILSAADSNLGNGGGSGFELEVTGGGDGMTVIVAAGIYQEIAPIQIKRRNVSIVGMALRSTIVHPTVATEKPSSNGNSALFELNSGSFIQNLTLTGMQASSSGTNTIDSVLPDKQGWNFAFYDDSFITKSPYIQNCTNFSDSQIDNSDLRAHRPRGGSAGDLTNAPTGGGMLVDGSVPKTTSPLRSMVADSYTHVGLNGPGILVTNNGYAQCTSSYAFFNKYHIKALNGGQANLAASTTDFGEKALVADGKSTAAIFTAQVNGAASDGDLTFDIDNVTAGTGWFGDDTKPASNMLVTVNSVTYPVLSSTVITGGHRVTVSRPDPNNRSTNLGLNGAVADDAAVSFFLRSQIASSGHTMEYVGSGMDYDALPENGGVPDESAQITELNNGKIWTAITDHNGKFKIGGNQTDDPIFEVDQQLGFVTIPEGSIAFNLLSDLTPQLGGNLDVNGQEIVTDAGNENIVLNPHGTGAVNVSSSKIINVTDPTNDQDASTKKYVDDTFVQLSGSTLTGNLDLNTNKVVNVGNPTDAQDAATKSYVDSQIGGIDEVVEDATPQLGGNLDLNSNNIDGTGNIDITGSVTASANSEVNGISIGRGAGDVATNTVVGNNALDANTTGSNNTAIGDEALTTNTTGGNNTAVGHNSLTDNTGSNNTATGQSALQSNTSGSQNTAVGREALRLNTTASNNTAVGHNALYANTTGTQNIAVGNYTLDSTTTGNNSVAVGYGALEANTTGAENTAVGAFALDANTTASNNTAVGYNAATANTTGTSHVAVGLDSLKSITTANACTAIGRSALQLNTAANNVAVGAFAADANTSGSNIVAVGYDALSANTTGAQNTAVGALALDANTTSNNSTAIGFANLSSSTGASNTGTGSYCLNSNTSGTQNVAMGHATMQLNTTGSSNTAIGESALYSNTTGGGNVAVGFETLNSNTTISNQTACGFRALKANTSGANGTGVGKNALVSNTTGSSNTAVGKDALESNTTGSNNNAVGVDALRANTTADNNTAVGHFSLGLNTTGTRNTAVGSLALDAITTGNHSTAVGYAALSDNTASSNTAVGSGAAGATTTGANIVAIGYNALTGNTTGAENVAVGSLALDANTTSSYSTAVGSQALGNSTGNQNTAVGRAALNANTTANDNVAVGFNAMLDNTTGTENVAVGSVALDANTTGSENTAIGYEALSANSTNGGNTAVGRKALRLNTAAVNTAVGSKSLESNTSGTENVAVGYAALDANTTANNNVAVGYASLGANTTGAQNVAIGANSLVANTTAGNNTSVGNESMQNNTTGQYNVAVGSLALRANTSAAGNTAVGYNAMTSNTSGTQNVAFGTNSLDENTTGDDLTAIGYEALASNTTAGGNTACGHRTLLRTTTGNYNTAGGRESMRENTTGISNTAWGAFSLDANTTGDQNVAIGVNALTNATTANNNTAVGFDCLEDVTDGYANTAVGSQTLKNVTSGNTNTAVGYAAGVALTSGTKNTFLGHDAGDSVTDGFHCICIGDNANPSSASGQRQIVMGDDATGKGNRTFFVTSDSGVYHGGNTSTWSTTSDRRVKKNIVDNSEGLSLINQIAVKNFEYKTAEEIESAGEVPVTDTVGKTGTQVGVIAQELQQVRPSWVTTRDNGTLAVTGADEIIWHLVNAVQELSAKNTALEARIAALESA